MNTSSVVEARLAVPKIVRTDVPWQGLARELGGAKGMRLSHHFKRKGYLLSYMAALNRRRQLLA